MKSEKKWEIKIKILFLCEIPFLSHPPTPLFTIPCLPCVNNKLQIKNKDQKAFGLEKKFVYKNNITCVPGNPLCLTTIRLKFLSKNNKERKNPCDKLEKENKVKLAEQENNNDNNNKLERKPVKKFIILPVKQIFVFLYLDKKIQGSVFALYLVRHQEHFCVCS